MYIVLNKIFNYNSFIENEISYPYHQKLTITDNVSLSVNLTGK